MQMTNRAKEIAYQMSRECCDKVEHLWFTPPLKRDCLRCLAAALTSYRNEGLEEAAKIVDQWDPGNMAPDIRALKREK